MMTMTVQEIAWEFAGIFEELEPARINELLAQNVPIDALAFFTEYSEQFAETAKLDGNTAKRLPNLMLIGYLLRVLEERLLETTGPPQTGLPD